eukprot:5789865-Amphidinium_carterae.1
MAEDVTADKTKKTPKAKSDEGWSHVRVTLVLSANVVRTPDMQDGRVCFWVLGLFHEHVVTEKVRSGLEKEQTI